MLFRSREIEKIWDDKVSDQVRDLYRDVQHSLRFDNKSHILIKGDSMNNAIVVDYYSISELNLSLIIGKIETLIEGL